MMFLGKPDLVAVIQFSWIFLVESIKLKYNKIGKVTYN